jgi:hypothetical protein
MKLSKNNKQFLSIALKDKTSNYIYSESKAASICSYSADFILQLSEKDLSPLNIYLDNIEDFSDLKFLFENEVNHKKLLSKTIIRSENPFILSMLDLNKTSKIKYFIELICLNKIELIPEFSFFSDFFSKLHKTNFLYLYQTNNLDEFAEIRFILQVESFYQKTFLISKDANYESNHSHNDIIINETDKNQLVCERKISMNNTTIKEVTEDEKNIYGDSMSRIQKSKNQESLCNLGMNENSNFNYNNNNNNNNNKNLHKNIQTHNNKQNELNKNDNFAHEYLKTFSFKNNIELKKTLNLDLNNNSGIGIDKLKPSNTEENVKYSNKNFLDFKSKNSIENQNISTIKDQKRPSTNSKQTDFLAEEDEKNNVLLNEINILEEIENNQENKTNQNDLNDKSLKFDNNIDFNVEEKNEQSKAFDTPEKINNNKSLKSNNQVNNITQPEKEMESAGSLIEKKSKKSVNRKNQNENEDNKDLSQRSKNVFLTGKDTESQQKIKHLDIINKQENEFNDENCYKEKSLRDDINQSRKLSAQYINNKLNINNNQAQNFNMEENENSKINIDKEAKKKKNNSKSNASLILNENQKEKDEKEIDYNFVFSNNDVRSENKDFERSTNNNILNSNNNFFSSTNPYGTYNSTLKKVEFSQNQIFEINFDLRNYNFIYIDLDYTVRKNLKSTLEKICKFVQWAWENFRYIKFVLYLPKIQDFFLDLNQDFFKEFLEILTIADIILLEKKEIISYKNSLKEISIIKKNQTASQFFNFNNTTNTFYSNFKSSNKSQKLNITNNNIWEEFFLSEFKIKKRSVPLLVYPTKTLVILDELSSIIIYEKNYENKLIFKTETDFILYPQINHTNQNIIDLYKTCLVENYSELRGIFFGGFLSKIMQKPVKVDTIVSKDYTGAYMISIELAKKFLKLFFHQKPYPLNAEFYLIKLDKINANVKLAEDIHRRRESKFVLDCANEKKSFLKFYQPLNDHYLKDFFSLRSVSNTMRNFGFEKNQGKFIEPEKNSKIVKKNESLKIGGKFFLANPQNKLNNNYNKNAFENSSINNSNLNINSLGIGSESPNNAMLSNYKYFHLLSNLNSGSNLEGNKQRGNSLLTRSKVNNINVNGHINFNGSGNNFGKTSKSFMQKPNTVNSVFGKNINVNLPRLVTPQVKIDPEEQIRNYVEFEKNLILN